MKAPLVFLILASFLISSVLGPLPLAQADEFHLPAPGVMVHLSPPLDPPILKGIKVHPDNPFNFDFILDKGDSQKSNEQLKEETSKLIKYFLASLTIPDKDLWVNLSPYEKDRIIPQSFGLTEMGRDLLAEDYMLKQITASLIYPEDEVGKKFWKRIYGEALKKFGTSNIPVNTFNKVWIVPEKAVVYENAKAGAAYVVEARLKVMLEQDYLALSHSFVNKIATSLSAPRNDTSTLGSQIIREIVIPELTREVNEDKNFIKLRQVYNSLILAAWYKKRIKDSILTQVYADKKKVAGVGYDVSTPDTQLIYQRYLRAFKKGVYNYIKEDFDPMSQETIPRKYFSGGMELSFNANKAMTIETKLGQMPVEQGLLEVSLRVRPLDNAMKAAVKMVHNSPVAVVALEHELEKFDREARSFPRINYPTQPYFEEKERSIAHSIYTLFGSIDLVLKEINKGRVYYIYPFSGPDIIPNIFGPTFRINRDAKDFGKGADRVKYLLGDIPTIGPILHSNHGILDRESDAYVASGYDTAFSESQQGKRVLIIKGFGWGEAEGSGRNLSLLQELLSRLSKGDKVLILDYRQKKSYENLIKAYGFKEVSGLNKEYNLIGSAHQASLIQDKSIWCDDRRLNLPDTFVLLEKTDATPVEFVRSSPVNLPVIEKYDPAMAVQVAGLVSDIKRLSGQGFVMHPQTRFKGEDQMEPLIKESMQPFDFKTYQEPHRSVTIGSSFDPKELVSTPLPNVTHLALKIAGSKIVIPVEFMPIEHIIQSIVDNAKANDPHFDNKYVYLTVLQSELQAGEAQVHAGKIPRVHADGIQREAEHTPPDYTYIASASDAKENLGTVIYTHPFHLEAVEKDYDARKIEPDKRDYTLEMTRQAQDGDSYQLQEGTIALFNAYVVHQAPVVTEASRRVVVRIRIGSTDAFIGRSDTTPSPFDLKLYPLNQRKVIPALINHRKTEEINNAMLSVIEPQVTKNNVYGDFMRNLVVKYSSEESQKRLRLLHELGPQIEKIARDVLNNQHIKIAVVPRGSTLKGYAGMESDVEYTICILSGAEDSRTVLEPQEEHDIFKAVNDLVAQKGYEPERLLEHNFIHISNYSDIDNMISGSFLLEVFAQEASSIFLPVVFGDGNLIDQVRRNLLSAISKERAPLRLWKAIKDYLAEQYATAINSKLIVEKSHLRGFFLDNRIDPASKEAVRSFNLKRQIPALKQMLDSYDFAQASFNRGGIDFRANKMNDVLQVENKDGEICFHLDPAMLKQLQNAPGFVPVIINIQPLKSLQEFLGLNQDTVKTS